MSGPTNPVLRWHGGKWRLAPWIISHFPAHRIYVEPYGGAGSVLMRKPRSYAEVWNDLDHDVVNLFGVLRSERAGDLVKALALTPFARDEFALSYMPTDDQVEKARRLVIRSLMGFGSDGCNEAAPTGFRANSNRSGSTPAHVWKNYPAALVRVIERLSGVIVENREALGVMAQHDSLDTLHYLDPPYMHASRARARNSVAKNYRHEMPDADHMMMLNFIKALRGKVCLSGYPSAIYDAELTGWRRVERRAYADGGRSRTEVLWMNFAHGQSDMLQQYA